jgi:hypothetical protein
MSDADTIVFRRQKAILRIGYWLLKPFALFVRRLDWVVGPEDIALMTTNIARALPRSRTVVHSRHAFYSVDYDIVVQTPSNALGGRIAVWRALYGGPLVLAWLLNRTRGFIYVGGLGYLQSQHDEREFEFEFITRHRRRIVCYFTGNDIRSPQLMIQRAAETGKPNLGSIVATMDPIFASVEYDDARRHRAETAERYADTIFTAREDQLSYLSGPTRPFRYFHPDDEFSGPTDRFDAPDTLVVTHAPSNPHLKGTEAVREAMSRICAKYPQVEYRELSGVAHEQVMAALDETHIAVNQFYASMPGVFGIEALAHRCVVVMSARSADEPDLGPDADDAWVHAEVDNLYEVMAGLVDNSTALKAQSERGWQWAKANASASASRAAIASVLAQ